MRKKSLLPKLGMRTIKTAICVAICLFVSGLYSKDVSLYSTMAAIVCMQSTIENTLRTGFFRLLGTAIGGGFGMLFLLFTTNMELANLRFVVISLGTIVVIYFCNLIKMQGSATMGAIVFVSVFVSPLMTSVSMNPYILALMRIFDTVVGIVVATVINRYIAPARRYEPKEVRMTCETFTDVYARVKDRLYGNEKLILYDSSLTMQSPPSSARTMRIPLPEEYKTADYIPVTYINKDFSVLPMNLKQDCGYIEIPEDTLPCTLVYQADHSWTESK
ncbi:MAG: FUSC family protein [Christensenellaceae bacterium]|jgi:uncharacterized membrane protein YgaE (UPF0421/DUF939 family)